MSGNLFPTQSDFPKRFYCLNQGQGLRLAGPDALDFAQAQFANDVRVLADGQWQWTAWLNAKGRVIAIFQLLRLDQHQLLLLNHDNNTEALAEQLRGFVFRRKVRITLEPLYLEAAFQVPGVAKGANLAYLENGVIELDMGNSAHPRALHLLTHASRLETDENFVLAWQQTDLYFGLPHLEPTQRQQWTPQQLGLERLAAYSVKKGCYPGQEIVARTHFLGKAKRSTYLLQLSAPAFPGTAVTANDQAIGTLISQAGLMALALLPLEQEISDLQVNGAPTQLLPMREGLAR